MTMHFILQQLSLLELLHETVTHCELGTSQVSTTDDADKPDISLAIQSHKSHFIPYT